jgi:hypothetical protein
MIYKFSKEFSKQPGPRFIDQGDNSAEQFCNQFIPLLKNNYIILDLNDTLGFGSSFLDELAKQIVENKLQDKLKIKCTEDNSVVLEIEENIKKYKKLIV